MECEIPERGMLEVVREGAGPGLLRSPRAQGRAARIRPRNTTALDNIGSIAVIPLSLLSFPSKFQTHCWNSFSYPLIFLFDFRVFDCWMAAARDCVQLCRSLKAILIRAQLSHGSSGRRTAKKLTVHILADTVTQTPAYRAHCPFLL